MKIFTKNYQPQILDKYKINFSNISLQEIKVPNYGEYIGTIYLFVNNINQKVYIGQTMVRFYERFSTHYTNTFTQKDSLIFHKALRKYGWENFSKYILWQDDKIYQKENKASLKELLDQKEIEYITLYQSDNIQFGYNMTFGGTYLPKNAYTKEAIIKANKTRDENKSNYMLGRTYEQHHLAIPILQFDYNKNLIKRWSCVKLASDTLGITVVPQSLTSGGYFWIYDTENYLEILEKKYNLRLKHLGSKTIDFTTGKCVDKIIYCFDLYKNFIAFYSSVKEAAKSVNGKSGTIANVARLKENGNILYDYMWIYEEDLMDKDLILETLISKSKKYFSNYRPVYQIFLNGEVIKLWNCQKDIITKYPFMRNTLNKCLNHQLNAYFNCLWIFADECTDELIQAKIESFSKTKKSELYDIQTGKILYEEPSENMISKYNTVQAKNKLKKCPIVYQFDKNLILIKIWENYKSINKETGLNFDTISKCLRHKLKTAYGYIWRFKNDLPETYTE